jgi:hypothetical protein
MTPFLALLTSLPTGNSTLRMRVWRELKSTGCGVLRDGVYILPASAPRTAALVETESAVRAAGGFAMTVEMNMQSSAQLDRVRKLFDRSEEYGALVAKIGAAKNALRRLGKRKADTLVQRLRRSQEELAAIDFYPGQAQMQAKDAMSALEREAQELFSGGEPHSAKGKVRRLDPVKHRNRAWPRARISGSTAWRAHGSSNGSWTGTRSSCGSTIPLSGRRARSDSTSTAPSSRTWTAA